MLMLLFFFFNDTATTEIYTLSLQTLFRSLEPGAALVYEEWPDNLAATFESEMGETDRAFAEADVVIEERSEEHTSELQSLRHLVCRLLLEKKKNMIEVYTLNTKTNQCATV